MNLSNFPLSCSIRSPKSILFAGGAGISTALCIRIASCGHPVEQSPQPIHLSILIAGFSSIISIAFMGQRSLAHIPQPTHFLRSLTGKKAERVPTVCPARTGHCATVLAGRVFCIRLTNLQSGYTGGRPSWMPN